MDINLIFLALHAPSILAVPLIAKADEDALIIPRPRQKRTFPHNIRQLNNIISDSLFTSLWEKSKNKNHQALRRRRISSTASSPSSCENSIGWHADTTTSKQNGCSNDDNYPNDWLEADMKEFMFFETSNECCQTLFNGKEGYDDCKVHDHGCQQQSSPSSAAGGENADIDTPSCISIGWHVHLLKKDGCTNDDNYEEEWKKPGMKEYMIFDSADECCTTFFPNGECQIYKSNCALFEEDGDNILDENCDKDESTSHLWHPNFETKAGCTNDDNIPQEYLEGSSHTEYVFDAAQSCCEQYSNQDGICPVVDICSTIGAVTYLSGVSLSSWGVCCTLLIWLELDIDLPSN